MNERGDDTTKSGAESPPRAPGSYYYDDATGYELFDPEEGEEGDGRGEEPGGGGGADETAPPRAP